MKKIINNQKGLTLIELIVAVFIFSLLSTVIAGIYVSFSNAQARTKVSQSLLNDAQFALEGIAREIRNSRVVYAQGTYNCSEIVLDVGPPPVIANSCIYLQKEDGSYVGFGGSTAADLLAYMIRDSETGGWSIHDFVFWGAYQQNIKLDDIQFIIHPNVDGGNQPFIEGGINQHPLVTIKLTVSTNATKDIEQITYNLQTTVSPRFYGR